MNISTVCRTCLATVDLNPIFCNMKDIDQQSRDLYKVAGVKIKHNDGLPQNMCAHCANHITNCIKFRKQCKNIESQLIIKIKCANFTNETDLKIEKVDPNGDVKTKHGIKDEELVDSEEDRPLIEFDVNEKCEVKIPTELHGEINAGDSVNSKLDHLYFKDESDTGNTRVNCKFCNKSISKSSIYFHENRYHPEADERKVKCELCDMFILKSNILKHKTVMHGTQPFLCRFCKSEFTTTEQLIQHVATCTSKNKRRKASLASRQLKECEVCHKLMQKGSLKRHKAVKHDGLGPVCEHCGRRLGNKFRLQEHLRAKHGYEKFKCSYCEFQSAGRIALWNHERRHRGEKPFVCETCGAKFHAAYLLAQHKQSHRTEKLAKCDQCPARFKANNSLHTHRLACHSAARYRCPGCGRGFRCRRYALRHLRRAHPQAGPPPHIPRDQD